MARTFVLLIIMCGSLMACQSGGSSAPSTGAPPANPLEQVTNGDPELSKLNLPALICETPGKCPQAVGELIVATANGPRFCTVTLVATDLILTAGHCISRSQLNVDQTFVGGCWARWPTGEVAKCEKLVAGNTLSGEPRGRIRIDHAFIQLNHPQNSFSPLNIHNEDADPNAYRHIAQLYGVDLGNEHHSITGLRCIRDDDYRLPNLKTIANETIILPNCPIRQGYSGGPIIEPKSGSIIGVLSFMKVMENGVGPAVGTDVSALP